MSFSKWLENKFVEWQHGQGERKTIAEFASAFTAALTHLLTTLCQTVTATPDLQFQFHWR